MQYQPITGFIYAVHINYDIALQFDGDGQHNAKDIKKIIEPILRNEADIVIGSRFLSDTNGFKSTRIRRIGIKIFEIVNSILIRQHIKDNTSGFRAYNAKTIQFLAKNYPHDYPEPETIILLGKNKFKLKEVPVLMYERQGGTSSIFGFKSVYYMIKVILAILVTYTRKNNYEC